MHDNVGRERVRLTRRDQVNEANSGQAVACLFDVVGQHRPPIKSAQIADAEVLGNDTGIYQADRNCHGWRKARQEPQEWPGDIDSVRIQGIQG
jgi:hypothetical protein